MVIVTQSNWALHSGSQMQSVNFDLDQIETPRRRYYHHQMELTESDHSMLAPVLVSRYISPHASTNALKIFGLFNRIKVMFAHRKTAI